MQPGEICTEIKIISFYKCDFDHIIEIIALDLGIGYTSSSLMLPFVGAADINTHFNFIDDCLIRQKETSNEGDSISISYYSTTMDQKNLNVAKYLNLEWLIKYYDRLNNISKIDTLSKEQERLWESMNKEERSTAIYKINYGYTGR